MRELKCRDLMIGDWVQGSHGTPMQVCVVGEDYANATFEGDEGIPYEFYDGNPDEFYDKVDKPKGIEITKEILDNNGFRFEKDYGSFYRSVFGDYYFKSESCVNVEWLCSGGGKEIVYISCVKRANRKESGLTKYDGPFYVHDLQHALRLIGLNDVADNFKL